MVEIEQVTGPLTFQDDNVCNNSAKTKETS